MENNMINLLKMEFDFIAENGNQEEEVYTEEGIKKTLDYIDRKYGFWQALDELLMEAYEVANAEVA